MRFLNLLSSLFSLSERKELEKKRKNVPFYRFVTSAVSRNFFRLPAVISDEIPRNHGEFSRFADFSLSAKWYAPIIKACRAYSAFADHNEFLKRTLASRFRRIFTRYE